MDVFLLTIQEVVGGLGGEKIDRVEARDAYDPSSRAEWVEKAFGWKGATAAVIFGALSVAFMLIFVTHQVSVVSLPHLLTVGILPLIVWATCLSLLRLETRTASRISLDTEEQLRKLYGSRPPLTPVVREVPVAMPFRQFGQLVIPDHVEKNLSEDARLWMIRSMLDSSSRFPLDDSFFRTAILGVAMQGIVIFGPFPAFKFIHLISVLLVYLLVRIFIDHLDWISAKRTTETVGKEAAQQAIDYSLKHLKSNPNRGILEIWNLRRRRRWLGLPHE